MATFAAMSSQFFDVVVVGGGIVGLATVHALTSEHPHLSVAVVDKEPAWAAHQTGHNSGVIHSGIYYKPGSLKARMCAEGARSMVEFAEQHGIAHDVCGKLIVATKQSELARMETLLERAAANGIPHERVGPDGLRDIEPHVAGIGGIHVRSTGIIDYRAVTETYAKLSQEAGASLRPGTTVLDITGVRNGQRTVVTDRGDLHARFVVNCGGLFSDRLAIKAGSRPASTIVPFRGEYFELADHRRSLVNALIYPVPDPAFPFLGVHFTRMIDGSVHCGPNAVLAWKREGYRKTDVDLRDLGDTLRFGGFWKLARKHGVQGGREVMRSFSKRLFAHSLAQLIPEVTVRDIVPSAAGVRAQALRPDGGLVDDFDLVDAERALHVLNAPSPAATSSLQIGREIASRIPSDL
jgi:(S)-2-hydroxyglutarate dehydrogenase